MNARPLLAQERAAYFAAIRDGQSPIHDYPPSVYIAAPLPMRDAARSLMAVLEAMGYDVTSTWLKRPLPAETGPNVNHSELNAWARRNLTDIRRSHVVVAMNFPHWRDRGTGGRHFETGYAVAMLIPVILFGGPHGNVFHYLDEDFVRVVESSQQLYDALQTVTRNGAGIDESSTATTPAPTTRPEPAGGLASETPSASASRTLPPPEAMNGFADQFQGEDYPHAPTETEWRDLERPIEEPLTCQADHGLVDGCSLGCAIRRKCIFAHPDGVTLRAKEAR